MTDLVKSSKDIIRIQLDFQAKVLFFKCSDSFKLELLGPDHLQLTLFNWDTESVLVLKKTASELEPNLAQ